MDPNKYKIYDDICVELWCENPGCEAMKDVGQLDIRHVINASHWLEKEHICDFCEQPLKTQYDTNIKELTKDIL